MAPNLVDPGTFAADVGAELGRLFRAPRVELVVLVCNAAIVVGGWWLLPDGLKDWLFDRVPGPLAFAIVLESWLLSDVTSTNLLGHDAPAAATAVGRPGAMRRLLRVKSTALAVLVGFPCALVAVVIGALSGSETSGVEFVPVLLAVPFGVLPLSCWFGVLLPFRVRPLRWRWHHRRPWSSTVRWATAVAVPYWSGGILVTALIVPAMIVGTRLTGGQRLGPPTAAALAVAVPLVCVLCTTVFAVATGVAERLATLRRVALLRQLEDPAAG